MYIFGQLLFSFVQKNNVQIIINRLNLINLVTSAFFMQFCIIVKENLNIMIKTENIGKTFKTKEIETIALKNISLEVKEHDFVAIMGPSGCGKSTLLHILGLLDYADQGVYYFKDIDVTRISEKKRAEYRKKNIGFIFQNFNLIDELNVYENIELPLIYLGYSIKERIAMVNEAMEKVKVTHRKSHLPLQLSGGQQQRVAVARALVTNPKLILADEPTGNLDSAQGDEIMQLLSNLNNSGTTIIMVTHSKRDADFSKRVIRLFDGKIIHENLNSSN